MIEGIAGVIIWTDNLDRMVPFYRDTMGLTVHSVQPNFVAFTFNGVRLSVGLHSEVSGATREPYRIMINLGVSDIHNVYRELSARGVEFLRPPEREHWGGWVATFRDPDGNILQLLQQPEQADSGC
jgi:predicted enzyme related to lactoylglutathione lyase